MALTDDGIARGVRHVAPGMRAGLTRWSPTDMTDWLLTLSAAACAHCPAHRGAGQLPGARGGAPARARWRRRARAWAPAPGLHGPRAHMGAGTWTSARSSADGRRCGWEPARAQMGSGARAHGPARAQVGAGARAQGLQRARPCVAKHFGKICPSIFFQISSSLFLVVPNHVPNMIPKDLFKII